MLGASCGDYPSKFEHPTHIRFYSRGASYAQVLAVVVCLSACLSHAGIVPKRLNVGSRKQRHVIAQGL